jgi:hypothetical protein
MTSKLNTLILLLILIALIGGGVLLVRTIEGITQPLEDVEQTLEEQFEQITKPTPTIIPDPITIIREVRSLARLETASYTVEKIITAESRQGPFSFLFGDKLILVAHGQVIAGVDLTKMQEDDIVLTEDGGVVVTLPPAEVFVATLDNQQSYVFNRDTGVVGMNPALETEARKSAEQEILNAALEDGILEMAQRNAEVYVQHLIITMGFRKVDFADIVLPTE